MNKALRNTVAAIAAAALLTAAFFTGALFERLYPFGNVTSDEPTSADFRTSVEEVRGVITREALEPSTEESMTIGAIQGLLESLDDPYALYFDAKHYGYMLDQTKGEYYGIGVSLQMREGFAAIVSVFEDTPAEAAGLQPEDVIVSIDGQTREQWDIDEVVALIRGPEGTTVELGIEREGESGLDFEVERARIVVPNYEQRLIGDDVGYVRLYGFNELAADEVRQAVEELAAEGAKGFILDLRDNPGGLLGVSVDVCSLFIPDGVAVRVEARGEPEQVYRVSGATVTDAPLVVLINENSASASEIVAGALQDYSRATLVGVKSYGKGSVQDVVELNSIGGAIKLTVAEYLTPQGRAINGTGLIPDVAVEMEPEAQAEEATDVQLQRAISVLRGKL